MGEGEQQLGESYGAAWEHQQGEQGQEQLEGAGEYVGEAERQQQGEGEELERAAWEH